MGAILKIRFLRSLYDPTCRITDTASITNTPPINGNNSSCLMITATVPIAPPSASDPTSPINTSAGCALYHRNPIDDPTIAPQKINLHPPPVWQGRYFKERRNRWGAANIRDPRPPPRRNHGASNRQSVQ